jgi:hypothetical protein
MMKRSSSETISCGVMDDINNSFKKRQNKQQTLPGVTFDLPIVKPVHSICRKDQHIKAKHKQP